MKTKDSGSSATSLTQTSYDKLQELGKKKTQNSNVYEYLCPSSKHN